MGEPVVVTRELTKRYGEFTALDSLSIQVDKGKILGFIGPNGAGKTTTIKILVGLARSTSGSASIAGVDCVREAHKIKRLVGYMPDRFGSYDNMRVHEYLDFFGAAFNLPRRQRKQRIDEVLETTGSTYMRDRFVEALSHGMQQRIGIARTLLHDPEVLILDEPANGLDPHARIDMRNLLLRLAGMGKTLIVTSQILPELSRICDQVAIITHGILRAAGPLDEILTQVRQKRMIEVQIASSEQIESTTIALREALGEDVKIVPSATESIVRFETSQSDDDLGDVLARLVHQDIRVTQFREVPSDLEDAFLSVTQSVEDATC
ncbi:MAG: ABC transporter ATP-binding protein [Planctomycetes bacterium]|nr:ABC transporter ATP-binding protein [Planctomycetota bacterium]MBL7043813.1 ABC transporter ATP-binding protein [Pirellulaceae bacterium]